MRTFNRVLLILVSLLFSATSLLAQTAADVSGHWVGGVQARGTEIAIEFDIAKNDKGQFTGTFAQPDQGVKGLPISTITVDGRSVRFVVKANASEPGVYEAQVSEDGYAISGELSLMSYVLPFNLKWTGVARIAAAPKSAPIAKELEGTWNGALELEGMKKRLVLKMSNQADGTATGSIMSPDGSGIEIPVGMTQNGSRFTLDIPSTGASFSGVLSETAVELVGTWSESSISLKLTLRRTAN